MTPAEPLRIVEEIVVPVKGTDREFLAQQWAVELAASLDLPVRAIHVVRSDESPAKDLFAFLAQECHKWEVPLQTNLVRGSDVAGELVEELGARDLVVIGTEKLSRQFHVGSVAEELVRRAPCPVQVVRLQ